MVARREALFEGTRSRYAEDVTRFGEELVVFRSALFCPWFGATGAEGDEIEDDAINQFLLQMTQESLACRKWRPAHEKIEGALETEARHGNLAGQCALEHECADQIVGDGVHPKLPLDCGGGKPAKNIQSEIGLDLAVVQFDVPALHVQCRDGVIGKRRAIQQGGGDCHGLCAVSATGCLEADKAHGDLTGHALESLEGNSLGFRSALEGFAPAAAAVANGLARTMKADDEVDPSAQQLGEKLIAAVEAVGQEDIPGLEMVGDHSGQRELMGLPCCVGESDQVTAVKAEQPDKLSERKAAAFLLASGIVKLAGVFG